MSWPRDPRRTEVERPVLLTTLSVLAGWSLLGVLAAGLLGVLRPLESIRRSLEQIAMGVRAIETQTAPLGERVDTAAASLGAAADTLGTVAQQLADADRNLEIVAPSLRPR